MAVADQPLTQFSDTTAHKRAISDYISMISPQKTPMVAFYGLEGDPGKFQIVNWPAAKVEWLSTTLATRADTLNGSITSTVLTITVTDGSIHKTGDILHIDDEHFWVSSLAAQVLTVTRSFNATTNASHDTGAVVTRIGNARLPGADADYERAVSDVVAGYNYLQTLQGDITMAETLRIIKQYGVADAFDFEAAKKVPELTILLENLFFLGGRNVGSAAAPPTFGGLDAFIATNTLALATADLQQANLENQIEKCWNAGGAPDILTCGSRVKRTICGWYAPNVRTERSEDRGGVVIDWVTTVFGDVGIIMDRWCPATSLYIQDSEFIGFLTARPFFQEPLAKTGDAIKGEVITELTLVVAHEDAHAKITGIGTA